MRYLSYLEELEGEAIYIIREVKRQFQNPAVLFSGGKDSATVCYLIWKAFYPAPFPFPLVHIDTGHNFPEVLAFRDQFVRDLGARLVVGSVEKWIKEGKLEDPGGKIPSRNQLQIPVLLEVIKEYRFDALIGGARRDEEKARAKERIFSVRNAQGEWDPHRQRPEPWDYYNGEIFPKEHVRVFPLSNWTEKDVWEYILQEEIPLPSIYFSHEREVFSYEGVLFPVSPWVKLEEGEKVEKKQVRFRTVGDMTCSAAIESSAKTVKEILEELERTSVSERGSRIDDKVSPYSMEERKRRGYF